jgi:hypothetical protein
MACIMHATKWQTLEKVTSIHGLILLHQKLPTIPSSIVEFHLCTWKQIGDGLHQEAPEYTKEIMKQPLFGNPAIYTTPRFTFGKIQYMKHVPFH